LSRFDQGFKIPSRILLTALLLASLATAAAAVVTISEGDLQEFTGPCTLTVSESSAARTLTWTAVSGASSYKVGFRGHVLVGLAETSGTTFVHSGFDTEDCLEYFVVAYDGTGRRICAAHAPLVGKCQ